jgi:adenosyl cobinamide kinase/adenosyl cobinamide phosphate guanylyltransferase
MDGTTNPTDGATTAPKRHFDTLDESIAKMKLTFGNASLPEIFAVMVTVGYTAEKIAELKTELAQLETLNQSKIKEHADQSEEQEKFNAKREEINKPFSTHRALARILFKGDIHAWVALQLDSENPKAYADWVVLVTNFYAQFTGNVALITKAQGIGITAEAAAAQIQNLTDLQSLKESLRKETGEAQAATDARDCAFDALYPKYTEYIKYAKVLMPDNQLLEAIGVKVMAK